MNRFARHELTSQEVDERQYFDVSIEDGLLGRLKVIEPLVIEVINGDEQLFSVIKQANGRLSVRASATGKFLLKILRNGQIDFYYYFPVHEINPYVELLFGCSKKVHNLMLLLYPSSGADVERAVMALNDVVEDIRTMGTGRDFKRLISRFSKAADKRAKSLDAYIDALFTVRSRLVVVRLDLSYESGLFCPGYKLRRPLLEVKKDWAKMQRDLHKGVPIEGLLGFACKMEYGHSKGFHFHLLAFYDGAIYRKDIVLAKLIGVHWQNVITKGEGRYFNCNNQQFKYLYRGIGVIGCHDTELINNLKGVVAAYLTKVDYWVRVSPSCGRAFFRGNMPRRIGVKRGRPRNADLIQVVG